MRTGPPRIARQLVWLLLPDELAEEAACELDELHAARACRSGRRAADWWYRREVLGFVTRVRLAWWRERLDEEEPKDRRAKGAGMRTLMGDVRYAARTLRRSPGFGAIALLTLALGIGANTAIFSVVQAVLLRPLPFPAPERLVAVMETRLDRGWTGTSFTHANFWDFEGMNRTFEAVGAMRGTTLNLTGLQYPERLNGAYVSADFFRVLGAQPVAGRTFAPDEDDPAADTRVAVLSHALWRSRFGSDPGIVGRSLDLDGQGYTVIGVLPPGTPWLDAADIFIPLVRRPDANRNSFELQVIGRLRSGVTLEAALEDVQGIAQRLAELYPEPDAGMGITLVPSSQWIANAGLRRALWVLMGGVGLLLLIACVNLANLLLARWTGRAREQALRTALGASRRRLISLALAESLILGLAGAVLGLGLAFAVTRLLRAYDPGGIPRLAEVGVDGTVLLFTLGIALLTGLLTGLLPALRAGSGDLAASLREGDRSVMGNRRQGRLRAGLVGLEVALALMLLVGAGLLLRSFSSVIEADRGFETDDRMFFEVALPSTYRQEDGAERSERFMREYLSRIQSLGPVVSAAAINVRPLGGVNVGMGFAAADQPAPPEASVPWASWRLITRGYFRTLGVPLLAGRDFEETDIIGNPWRVIISKRIADTLWPGQDAVGRTMNLWQGQNGRPAEVIGVVADMLDWGLELGPTYAVYMPAYGITVSPVQFVVHTTSSPTSLVPQLRAILGEIDPELPLSRVQTVDDMIGSNVASRRFLTLMLAAFAGVALLLALAGVYGVLSYTVARRRSEIGVRVALGASRGQVLGLIVKQGMRPVILGLLVGIVGALALSRLMVSILFGVSPADLTTYVAVAALLATAAVISCLLPAHAALRTNVVAALREE